MALMRWCVCCPCVQPKETTDIRDFLKRSRQPDAKCTDTHSSNAVSRAERRDGEAAIEGASAHCIRSVIV